MVNRDRFSAQYYASACRHEVSVRPYVRPSRPYILSKRIDTSSKSFHHSVPTPFLFLQTKCLGDTLTGTPITRSSNKGGVGRNRDFEPISGFIACCCDRQVLSTRRRRTVASGDTYLW